MQWLYGLLRFLFYCAVGGVIVVAGVAYFFMTWEPDRDEYAFRGIDISHHNGPIDWARVADDDVAFVYMKASEGADFKDRAFLDNWAGAKSVGLPHGAYHFFSLCRTGAAQADNFLAALPDTDGMLPPVVDLEFEGNCARRPPVEEVLSEISDYVGRVEQSTGKPVILYAPQPFYEAYLKDNGLNRRLWVRSLWKSPDYSADWTLWQYHQRGAIRGIDTEVDLNVLAVGMTPGNLISLN
ncbi:lysozyme [Roseibium hamelinense]|nr:lysozyme [Roseibium hamelinense]